jgi:SAM-dependent methyltransferase
MNRPYHRFVFDTEQGQFVGRFEEMYRAEETEGFDSWFQEDMTRMDKVLARAILERHTFSRVLDIGCGKGTFTQFLLRGDNHVVGTDISPTAVARAGARHPGIEFRVSNAAQALASDERYDLVVTMEVLSYLEDWRDVIARIADVTRYYFLTLYIPPHPIGFVKSFAELRGVIASRFEAVEEIMRNGDQLLLLARAIRSQIR